ncbi:MAG: HypC/HybG/HupF family hydrogenase formation chaperone [Armatimonadota bacterium]
MCLAVPLQILEMSGSVAVCGHAGLRAKARLDLLDDAGVGDWVLVHAGFAITKMDPEEAREAWALVAEVSDDAPRP